MPFLTDLYCKLVVLSGFMFTKYLSELAISPGAACSSVGGRPSESLVMEVLHSFGFNANVLSANQPREGSASSNSISVGNRTVKFR